MQALHPHVGSHQRSTIIGAGSERHNSHKEVWHSRRALYKIMLQRPKLYDEICLAIEEREIGLDVSSNLVSENEQ